MRHAELTTPSGWTGQVVAHGHYGRPVLVFPSEGGSAWDFDNNGIARRDPVDGRRGPGEGLLRRLGRRADLVGQVRPARGACATSRRVRAVDPRPGAALGGRRLRWPASELITVGCSLGAFHAVNIALRRADLFPRALGLSGSYDPSDWRAWGERGTAAYFHNPIDYVPNLNGDHLDWLRSRVNLRSSSGRAPGRSTPPGRCRPLAGSADVLASKGIPHELDVWGYDVSHDWPSWRTQIAHHLPRLA